MEEADEVDKFSFQTFESQLVVFTSYLDGR